MAGATWGEALRPKANFVAKYVTTGCPTHRSVDPADADAHRCHLARIADTCRELFRRPGLADLNLDRRIEASWPTSRSRSYSTTMGALHQERTRHAAARSEPLTAGKASDDRITETHWRYVGSGWREPWRGRLHRPTGRAAPGRSGRLVIHRIAETIRSRGWPKRWPGDSTSEHLLACLEV